MDSHRADKRGRALEWWVLGGTVFVSFVDTFALLPVLPVYMRQIGAQPWQIGMLLSVYSLVGMAGQPLGGYVADVVGRKRPLVFSLLGSAVALGLYGAVPSVWWLLAMRVLHGLSGSLFLPALFALLGERAGRQRAQVMGRAAALIGLAAIVAPPVSGVIARLWGAPMVFGIVAALMALAAIGVWYTVPDTLLPAVEPRRLRPWEVLRVPSLRAVYALTAAFTFCMGTLAYGFPLLMVERGYTTATAGKLLGWMALVAVPVMAFLRWRQFFARAVLGLGIVLLSLLGIWWAHGVALLVLCMGLYGVGFGLIFPAVHVLTFEQAPAEQRGSAFALLYVAYSGGLIAGPAAAGVLSAVVLPAVVAAGLAAGILIGVVTWNLRQRWGWSVRP
ncbi:Bacillibactin exporter [bacterium HR21]|nr:Bacillibactin exporter [bacterium HR21]